MRIKSPREQLAVVVQESALLDSVAPSLVYAVRERATALVLSVRLPIATTTAMPGTHNGLPKSIDCKILTDF